MKQRPKKEKNFGKIVNWIFVAVFILIGILNLFLVHPVPFFLYILISLIYMPFTNTFLYNKFGFRIHIWVKIIFGLVILWGTLAVGDLAEILGL